MRIPGTKPLFTAYNVYIYFSLSFFFCKVLLCDSLKFVLSGEKCCVKALRPGGQTAAGSCTASA